MLPLLVSYWILSSLLITLASLIHVLSDILLLQFSHPLNLVEVDDEAGIVRVVQTDALSAKHCQVIRTVEVLHALWVLHTQLICEGVLIIIGAGAASLLEVKVGFGEYGVLFDDLIKNVDVEGESLSTLQLLDEFAADWAPHSVVVVQVLNARSAQGVPAVHQDAGDALTHVVPQAAELTDVQSTRRVVQVQDRLLARGGLLSGRVHIL